MKVAKTLKNITIIIKIKKIFNILRSLDLTWQDEGVKHKPGNRGDMLKIHVTRQFFEASVPLGYFFEIRKNGVGECGYRIPGLFCFSAYCQKTKITEKRHSIVQPISGSTNDFWVFQAMYAPRQRWIKVWTSCLHGQWWRIIFRWRH